jgi:hypothetical protein
LSEVRKEVGDVHRRFFKKLMGVPNCAVNGFVETEPSKEIRRGKSTVKYWCQIMYLEIEDSVKQC